MVQYYRYEMKAPADAVDANGHINNVAYVQWMQDAAVTHYISEGGEETNERENATWVVHKHSVRYRRPAFAGETIAVFTWIVGWTRATSRRRYAFVRVEDGAVLVEGETEWVFVDAGSGRPKPIPDSTFERFMIMPPDWNPPLR